MWHTEILELIWRSRRQSTMARGCWRAQRPSPKWSPAQMANDKSISAWWLWLIVNEARVSHRQLFWIFINIYDTKQVFSNRYWTAVKHIFTQTWNSCPYLSESTSSPSSDQFQELPSWVIRSSMTLKWADSGLAWQVLVLALNHNIIWELRKSENANSRE